MESLGCPDLQVTACARIQPWQRRCRSQRVASRDPTPITSARGASAGPRRGPRQGRSRGAVRGRQRGHSCCDERVASGPCLAAPVAPLASQAKFEQPPPIAHEEEDDSIIPVCDIDTCFVVGNLLNEALDDYCDDAMREAFDLDAEVVLSSTEPNIPEVPSSDEVDDDAVSVASCCESETDPVPTEAVAMDASREVSLEILRDVLEMNNDPAARAEERGPDRGGVLEEEEEEDVYAVEHIEQIRNHVRLLLEESVLNGSLEKILGEAEAVDSEGTRDVETPAPALSEVKDANPLAKLLQAPCTRKPFKPMLCPRDSGPPVPEEPFPMDCLPMSQPVAPIHAPFSCLPPPRGGASTARSTQVSPLVRREPIAPPPAPRPPQLSEETKADLFRNASDALAKLAEAALAEAVVSIQCCWRRHLAQKKKKASAAAAAVTTTTTEQLVVVAPRTPQPPESSGSGACAARRRLLARRDPAAVPKSTGSEPMPLPIVAKASPVGPPISPLAPAVPRTGRARPTVGLTAAAGAPPLAAAAPVAGLPAGVLPMAPPPRPPSAGSGTPRRPVRQLAKAGAWRTSAAAAAATETAAKGPSAMELDLGASPAVQPALAAEPALAREEMVESLRRKNDGAGVLPMLKGSQVLMAGSVAWSARGETGTGGKRQKSIDASRRNIVEVPTHVPSQGL